MARSKLLTVRASEQSMERLKAAAALAGVSKSEFVRQALSERIRVVESSTRPVVVVSDPPVKPVEYVKLGSEFAVTCRHGLLRCKVCGTG